MKINSIGVGYVIDLDRDDFYKVGMFIDKSKYTLQEMSDLVSNLMFQDEMYKDLYAKEYADKIVKAISFGEA